MNEVPRNEKVNMIRSRFKKTEDCHQYLVNRRKCTHQTNQNPYSWLAITYQERNYSYIYLTTAFKLKEASTC